MSHLLIIPVYVSWIIAPAFFSFVVCMTFFTAIFPDISWLFLSAIAIIIFFTFLYPIIRYCIEFIRSGKTFYYDGYRIAFWSIENSRGRSRWSIQMDRLEKYLIQLRNGNKFFDKFAIYFSIPCIIYIILPTLFYRIPFEGTHILWFLVFLILAYGILFQVIFLLLIVLRYLFQSFHPLYAFWNLWEKIQKLTPVIEKKSKEIQENFKKDMNFRILSHGFDSLSSTFSDIVSFVIKLEKIEQRANKWNLFDSEKYINSLRWDIVEPLKSLKTFLEKKKEELEKSQKELAHIRVRVWGKEDAEMNSAWPEQSGFISESALSSKRSESLFWELAENIERLDMMIAKMN